ncbi:hypothetical protein [Herpetosiphon giganteus]|uniref:hypothetical protein n=1 Tax=Herpetosiphon giganteus TaxID=2029754 RepID=UPI001959FE2F|nr:hypothetical protein [Herpetosiphon giganteus]MBM7842427.1 hypothetical protein [Herpetosiphon giganteus]
MSEDPTASPTSDQAPPNYREYGRHPYPYNQRPKPNNDPQLGYFVPAIPNQRGQHVKRWGCGLGYFILAIMASCIIVPILCIFIHTLRALFEG